MSDHQSTIAPGARPYLLQGGTRGILMIHGLGGSGDDFRVAANLLHQSGWTVSVMRVAGHGRTWREAADSYMGDWRASVDKALIELQQNASEIFILGSSFGGGLAFDAAVRHPGQIHGLVAVNTPLSYRVGGSFQTLGLHLLRLFSPVFGKPGLSAADRERYKQSGSLPAWPISVILESRHFLREEIRKHLGEIQLPLLHIENSNDPYVSEKSGLEIDSLYGGAIEHVRLSAETHRPFRDQRQTEEIVRHIIQFANQLPESKK